LVLILNSDQCPEFIIEMIKSKLDNINDQEKELEKQIEGLWKAGFPKNYSISTEHLANKLNEMISKLNNLS
jgi:hypothetical protein